MRQTRCHFVIMFMLMLFIVHMKMLVFHAGMGMLVFMMLR
jgi:hypothetical protein